MSWVLKENNDGTVTIDKKVYEELKRKAGEYQKLVDLVSAAILKAYEEIKTEISERSNK